MQLLPAFAQRMLLALVRPGDVAVDRDRDFEPQLRHEVRLKPRRPGVEARFHACPRWSSSSWLPAAPRWRPASARCRSSCSATGAELTPFLLGFAAGVMGVAAVAGLLIPATEEGSAAAVLAGLGIGVAFLVVARRRLSPDSGFLGNHGPGARTSALVFLVLFVHSLPEGPRDRRGLRLRPRRSQPLRDPRDRDPEHPRGDQRRDPDGRGGVRARAPVLGGGRDQRRPAGRRGRRLPRGRAGVRPAPFSFAFAAGAMLALIVAELLPRAYADRRRADPTGGIAPAPR